MGRSAIQQTFVDRQIDNVLTRFGVPHDNHVLREALDRDAVVEGLRDPYVRIQDGQGSTISLEDRIEELRRDPRYRPSFPADPPKVAKNDMAQLRSNFARIASGATVVE